MAGRMHESRLHEGKPADLPEPRESNSFRRAVRSIKNAVQKDSRHDENSDLIPLLSSNGGTYNRAAEKSRRDFRFESGCS